MDAMEREFEKLIEKLRRKKDKMGLAAMARKMGVPYSTLRDIIVGKSKGTILTMAKISRGWKELR